MKKSLVLTLVVLMGLAVAGTVLAVERHDLAVKSNAVVGIVGRSIHPQVLAVAPWPWHQPAADRLYLISPETKFIGPDLQPIARTDLQQGDTVRVESMEKDGTIEARTVMFLNPYADEHD